MKHNLRYIIFILFILNGCAWVNPSTDKPNVIIVLSDDQGYGDVGFNGNKMIRTPVLDALASKSVVFDKFYVSPVCAPTRASLLTGKYHLATGTSWVTHRKEVMRESEITIAEILKENGFKTGYFGKWHNGAQYPHNPKGQGFDEFFGFSGGHWNNYFDTELSYNDTTIQTSGYIIDVITDSVSQFIKNTKEPFLAYVAYNTPHTPYQVADEYYDYYIAQGLDAKTASIYGMCENIDDNVQKLQEALIESGKYENTLFIFMSDNGPNFVRFNGGLKGRKAQVHEGGVRVPFFINYPKAAFKARRVINNYATHIDILPTILDYCQISKEAYEFDGISLQKVISNPKFLLDDRKFYSHHVMSANAFCGAVRTNTYLLTCYPSDTSLYNLEKDPYQRLDISNDYPILVDSLTADYALWYQKVTVKGLIPEAIQIGHSNILKIDFPAHEAKRYGHVSFAGGAGWANDWVESFSSKEDSMTWDVKAVGSQEYQVFLKYACEESDRGKTLAFKYGDTQISKEITALAKGEIIPNKDRVERVEVNQRNWGILDFGNIHTKPGKMTFSISLNSAGQSNIQIKELVLNRIH